MAQFSVPQSLEGQTLRDIRNRTGAAFRADVLAGFGGIQESTPLRAGMTFNLPDDPGSAEFIEGSKLFQSAGQVQEQKAKTFQEEQRARTGEFIGRVQKIPETLEALRQELGIPQQFEKFGLAGGELKTALEASRDIPGIERGAGREFGLTEGQLAQIIAQKQKEAQPGLETKARIAETEGFNLDNLLREFQGRAETEISTIQIEQGVLGAENAELFANFRQQIKGQLDKEIEGIRQKGALDIETARRVNEVAKLEATLQKGVAINVGNRILLKNPVTGETISSDEIGRIAPLKPTTTGFNLQNFLLGQGGVGQSTPQGEIVTLQGRTFRIE